jgi:excisionase family DNA binding protein
MSEEPKITLPDTLSLEEVAEMTGLCGRTIRRRITDGTLRGYRVGPRIVANLFRPMPTDGAIPAQAGKSAMSDVRHYAYDHKGVAAHV